MPVKDECSILLSSMHTKICQVYLTKNNSLFPASNSNSPSVCHAVCIHLCYELRNGSCGVLPVHLAELNNALAGAGWVSMYQRHVPASILVNSNFTMEIEAG